VNPIADLRAAVEAAAADLRAQHAEPSGSPTLERPKKAEHGDYSTNAAMLLAPVLGEPPRAIAEQLGGRLTERLGPELARVDVAGPGFLNLILTDDWYRAAVAHVLDAGDDFGAGHPASPERVLVEFVSANPTGPLVAASGRHAAFGDALARLLELEGHDVEREYYVNDFGTQVRRLGESIRARARGEEIPEDGYKGDYVKALAAEIPGAAERDPDELARIGVDMMVERIKATLERFGVRMDRFFHERSLHEDEPDPVAAGFEELRSHGHLYEADGATWLRTTTFGDDKDRVLTRSSGEHTYFASDIAYHQHKRSRGFDRLINLWGADHHGYVQRMKAAFKALGGDPEKLELLIMQMVNFVEHGDRRKSSKRSGDFVTMDDLLDEIGVDAARWFMLARSHDTPVDIDVDLAREQSAENPVYYVQYAHARIASVLAKAGEARVAEALARAAEGTEELHPAERALVKKLLAFPEEMAEATERRAPHRVCSYALELAQEFTAFYRDCRVVGAEPRELEDFRLALSVATKRTIARSLGLLGVSAPESM
jgi:arginyl-tRNA synthetase